MSNQAKPRLSRAFQLQRAVDERRAAERATCEEAKIAHRQLALRYVAEARDPGSARPSRSAARARPPLSLWSRS